jgi:hypothetical protein
MEKYYYYIDYGSGYVNITPHDNNLILSWVRGELNDFIARKKLAGNFTLIDSEAVAAEDYFIVNGNLEAPIEIWEDDVKGSGTLIYEGLAETEGVFDYDSSGNAITVSFKEFTTRDNYTLTPTYRSSVTEGVLFENENNSIEELRSYTFDGTNFALTGNTLAVPNLGRIAADIDSDDSGIIYYIDNYTNHIRSFQYTAPNNFNTT